MKNTRLEDLYKRGDYTPPSLEEYVESVSYILSHIRPELTVHRITGDCPRDMLIAPEWNKDKSRIIEKINEEMKKRALHQGSLYSR